LKLNNFRHIKPSNSALSILEMQNTEQIKTDSKLHMNVMQSIQVAQEYISPFSLKNNLTSITSNIQPTISTYGNMDNIMYSNKRKMENFRNLNRFDMRLNKLKTNYMNDYQQMSFKKQKKGVSTLNLIQEVNDKLQNIFSIIF
jgi:vacuolar-type H+-ATPase catalytic subunit A/Vma1